MGKILSKPRTPVPVPKAQVSSTSVSCPVQPKRGHSEKALEPAATSHSDAEFKKDVLNALECPVCLETATPPVTLCKRGHFICGICRANLDICVICRDEYTNLRCYTVENIASKIRVKCGNKPCEFIETTAELPEHMERCDYRPVICNCYSKTHCVNKPIDFDKFLDHLRETHGAYSTTGLCSILISVENKKHIKDGENGAFAWGKTLFEHDGVTFIRSIALQNAVLYFWISAMLPELQASKYSADIHIGQKDMQDVGKINCDTRNIKWTIGVVPAHVTLKEMKDSKDCVAIPATRVISLSGTKADEGETFSLNIELKSRKL